MIGRRLMRRWRMRLPGISRSARRDAERRRTAARLLAARLAQQPRVMLLDEPPRFSTLISS